MKKQERKTYRGEKNDKERTMGKLLASIGKVLSEKGYTGLTVSNIAKEANVDRKLIALYFGSLDNLVETYIKGKDYWLTPGLNVGGDLMDIPSKGTKEFLESLLLYQMDSLMKSPEMREVILWQISEKSEIMSHVFQEREKMSSLFFASADKEIGDKNIDLRAISSVLVAAIYYLVLHAERTDSTVCEIDISKPEGMNRIKEAIKQIISSVYD
ncbi:TetR/AcrR family transcriptional regulator [Sphingobacterium faecale]|uniref:TetR/AcrR family transcriptional regulator n=1 Tax=Sphingobacterium faecale TaxID=2803775 RepID=A0ABS1R2L4_9SPHI|nr:TetR/AcrR family transcriptional regulator [Sphingobacterium faecale]MBL1408131.1 TetR/AcrR family transcriptional regulator [Sphingobacterium faecale]